MWSGRSSRSAPTATDPQERQKLQEQARHLLEQSKQQGQNAGANRSKGAGGGRGQQPPE
ncbi:DUF6381 family protein [Streptomyces sp. NBC_01224]|nr:DUF6381 family protein [Streptomyces sp. NBC_01224]